VASGETGGSRFSYRVTEPATVTLRVQRVASGRIEAGRCSAPSIQNQGQPTCRRHVPLSGSIVRSARSGDNSLRFNGRIAGQKLAPGGYRIVARARDEAGFESDTALRSFRIDP
jgi:hypothetical protein